MSKRIQGKKPKWMAIKMFAETFSQVICKQRGAQRLERGKDSERKNANIYEGKQEEGV